MTTETYDNLRSLADNAKCIDDADYGTNRQIDADVAFWSAMREAGFDIDDRDTAGMDSDECIDYGMLKVKEAYDGQA